METSFFTRGAVLLVPGFVCLLLSAPAPGEAWQLTRKQVVEQALQNNAVLNSFRQEKAIRDAGLVRAGLLPNPILDLEAGTGALTGSGAESSVSLGVSQEFLLSGKRAKRSSVAQHEMEIYRWQLADRERALRLEVETACLEAILAERRAALAGRVLTLNRQLLDVTRDRLEAGDIPELEMNLAKVEVSRSEGAQIDAANAVHRHQAQLSALMGLSPGEEPTIAVNPDAETIQPTKTLSELKQLARASRPDVKALEAEKTRGEAEITLARAEGVPNLTAGLALKRETTSIEVGGIEGKDTAYTIGLRLSMPIPLFDGNRAGVQEARARRQSAEGRLSAALKAVEWEVETAYAGFLNAGKVLSLYRTDIIPQLDENLKLTQEAYRLGEIGIVSVSQEQKKFFEVNNGYLTALYDRHISYLKLETAVASDLAGGAQ